MGNSGYCTNENIYIPISRVFMQKEQICVQKEQNTCIVFFIATKTSYRMKIIETLNMFPQL